jgi:tetratricopeptide (TPR) repeat protein
MVNFQKMYRIRTTPLATHPKAGAPQAPPLEPEDSAWTGFARVEALARAAHTSERLGLRERAIGLYQKALLELPPFTPPSRWEFAVPVKHNLALLLAAKGHKTEAVEQLKQCLVMLAAEQGEGATALRKRLAESLCEVGAADVPSAIC